jgi:hypothetical protein|tara:strand:+ start:254 stop:757 length:504 start_codon:yes stop_codon:yes gene_type:complete
MTIRSTRGPNVTPDEHKLVVKFAKQCLREICKKQYEIEYRGKPVVYAEAVKFLQVQTKYRSQSSYGGANRICIDMQRYRSNRSSFKEYASFADDPVIGNIVDCDDLELLLKCLVAHEVAHHIQSRYGAWTRYLKNTYRKPHGDAFKTIYRELRRTLVNPYINQSEAA